MNSLTLKNILTPIFGALATWLATKLNFMGMDQTTWNTIVNNIGFGAVALVLGFFNKTTNILDAAGNTPGTTVVTTKENADALPANKDVIAATPEIKTAVAKAS